MTIDKQKGVSLILTFFTAFYIFFAAFYYFLYEGCKIRRVRVVNNLKESKILKSENGVSLILTFFIMILVLAIVLSISVLIYSEVKIMRNMGNSVASFYAAESGIEKVLFYDRQVRLSNSVTCEFDTDCVSDPYNICSEGVCITKRGLCSIPDNCIPDSNTGSVSDHSVYCNSVCTGSSCTPAQLSGPDCINCTDCSISFNTSFGSNDGRIYSVTTKVNTSFYLDIASKGTFKATERQIRTTIPQ